MEVALRFDIEQDFHVLVKHGRNWTLAVKKGQLTAIDLIFGTYFFAYVDDTANKKYALAELETGTIVNRSDTYNDLILNALGVIKANKKNWSLIMSMARVVYKNLPPVINTFKDGDK